MMMLTSFIMMVGCWYYYYYYYRCYGGSIGMCATDWCGVGVQEDHGKEGPLHQHPLQQPCGG